MAWRALRRRCPRCGGKKAWFTGWFSTGERCRTCGYRYERHEGFVLGSVTMNIVLTFGTVLAVIVVGLVLTAPDVQVVPILAVAIGAGVLVPVVAYPVSSTLWAAIDLALRPLEPSEEADALTWVAARDATSPPT